MFERVRLPITRGSKIHQDLVSIRRAAKFRPDPHIRLIVWITTMFIVIIGTRHSGKSTLEDYLVSRHGFTSIHLESTNHYIRPRDDHGPVSESQQAREGGTDSFLTMNSPNPADPSDGLGGEIAASPAGIVVRRVWSRNPQEMLDHVTRDWRNHYVTADVLSYDKLHEFVIRPFVLIVRLDAPILERFRRMTRLAKHHVSLDKFIADHDTEMYGQPLLRVQVGGRSPIQELEKLAHLRIDNPFQSVPDFHAHLDSLDLLNVDRLRPHWDTYFMHLASLASRRSNCMKRRVGAILVRNNRVVGTGYNGTARGLRNCNEGGCPRCNSGGSSGRALDQCLCLHAEENALLEAGRDRLGENTVLYCNTCPCLGCSVKIIQSGVKEVVYHLGYKVDEASAALFREAGVTIRRHAPPDPF